ncbi:hypothetical protein AC1031_014990 [Aphanomyces cochlioides]|nr:hypothetical protein AC1031_014990 [Aphanomyces cochlioides]
MTIFVTGATGFIGSAVVKELLRAGHQVTGLARSQASAQALAATWQTFNHDYSKLVESCKVDGNTIRALGEALAGTNRTLVVTSAFIGPKSKDEAPDEFVAVPAGGHPRAATELAADEVAKCGVRVVTVRLPYSVHGEGNHHGFVPDLVKIAREKGVSAYVEGGENRWPAVHRLDAAVLFRFVVETATESGRAHATGEDGIPFRDIAQAIGKRLNVPVVSKTAAEARDHFGFLSQFVDKDKFRPSQWTRAKYGWQPIQPGLLQDIRDSDVYIS